MATNRKPIDNQQRGEATWAKVEKIVRILVVAIWRRLLKANTHSTSPVVQGKSF
jgi:hypothetical protein